MYVHRIQNAFWLVVLAALFVGGVGGHAVRTPA
jgi:hypothetical protein